MKAYATLFLLLAAASTAMAQSGGWELKLETEVYQPTLSPDGNHFIYFTDDDEVMATCVEVKGGKKLWTRTLKEFEQYSIARFIGNDTLLLGQENRYEFLNVKDGAVLKTLPIVGESWDDLVVENKAEEQYDTLKPYFKNSVGVFYFDDGMQIVDLANASIIHSTSESPGRIKYRVWEDFLLINPAGGADSIYVVDTKNRRLVYKASKYDNDINETIYQPFAVSNSEILLFNEDNTQSVDLESGKLNSTIEVDPDDPEFYTPVIFKNGLYLMVSDKGIQKLYRTKDGQMLWQTAEGDIPGIAEQLIELPNDEAMLMGYEPDGRMVTYKINATTGKTLWSKPLFIQDGELETGHKEGSKVWATLGRIAFMVLANAMNPRPSRWGYGSGSGFSDHNYYMADNRWRRDRREAVRQANDMYNAWINTQKKTEGYASLLESNDKQVVLATAGKIYAPGKEDSKTYNGEAVVTLNLADGAVISSTPCEMLAKSDADNFNAYQDLKIQKLDSAKALIGVHELYILRGDAIQKFTFGESVLSFINAAPNELTVVANNDDDLYDYWRIDASTNPARKYLLARSTSKNVVFHDSAAVGTMLKISEEEIAAYPVKEGDVSDATFASPKWKLSEDDLDNLDVGDLTEATDMYDKLQGIRIIGGDVLLMGDNALAHISSDGTCRWAREWSPNRKELKLGVTKVGNMFLYSTDGVTTVLNGNCPGSSLGSHKIGFADTEILTVPNRGVVVIDKSDGIIRGYSAE